MTFREALRARLLGETAAADEVFWLTRPQGDNLPSITLQMISGAEYMTYDGISGWRDPRVQLDAWAATPAQAEIIIEAVRAALSPRETIGGIFFDTTSFENERDSAEQSGTTTIYRTGIDLIARHRPA